MLGPGTLAQIHKSVGDTVTVRYGTTAPQLLRIVGTATMPAVGVGGVTGHASMGTGAVVPYQLLPASVRNQFNLYPGRAQRRCSCASSPARTPRPHSGR